MIISNNSRVRKNYFLNKDFFQQTASRGQYASLPGVICLLFLQNFQVCKSENDGILTEFLNDYKTEHGLASFSSLVLTPPVLYFRAGTVHVL